MTIIPTENKADARVNSTICVGHKVSNRMEVCNAAGKSGEVPFKNVQ